MMSQSPIDKRLPVDYIEPTLEVREAGMRYIDILEGFANKIESSLIKGNIRSVSVAFWSGAYALGLKCCAGMSMTERSRQIGVRRATISKNAKKFVESNSLTPSFYMKDKNAGRSYCKARLNVVANSNGKLGTEPQPARVFHNNRSIGSKAQERKLARLAKSQDQRRDDLENGRVPASIKCSKAWNAWVKF